MRLFTPDNLLYPVTVTKLLRKRGDDIEQNVPLFTYTYKSKVIEGSVDNKEGVEVEKTWPANFESELKGNVTSLDVKVGQVITRRTQVAEIEEPCKHEVQYGGMCANCGEDVSGISYNTTMKDTDRATVNTAHGTTALRVSRDEANKADDEAKRRLLDARKLSLVVDLDQTIIQATVDPTVAEWQKDPENPNYEAVKNVRAFQLLDEGPGARGCWYYIKLRPGLEEFLQTISRYYELHIYTMGTRAYAENIAKIIDPERNIFADRILSRDESGSLTAKNLKRLFPVDTKMVVIIDDRGDVWQWTPNLIKVSAYDFFVGIGDINSSFLPKRPELEVKPPKPAKAEKPTIIDGADGTSGEDDKAKSTDDAPSKPTIALPTPPQSPPQANGDASAVERLVSMAGKQDAGSMKEKTDEQDEAIAAQMAERPLLQKQMILDAAEEEAKISPAAEAAAELLSGNGEKKEPTPTDTTPKYRHNLLQDDDTELEHLGRSLRKVHQAFFDKYESGLTGMRGGRVAQLRPGKDKKRPVEDLANIPDAAMIMRDQKSKVLAGVSLVFSGVVPLGVDIHAHDTVIWAKSFGATVSDNITKRTTHVIASPDRRTAKVRQAAKKGGRIAIVSTAWLFACFSQWKKIDDVPYRIHSEAPANGTAGLPGSFEGKQDDGILSSSDEEAAVTDNETEPESTAETANGIPLTLDTGCDTDTEWEQNAPTDLLQRQDSSPIDQEVPEDWDDLRAEMAKELGFDWEDDSDSESVVSERGDGTKTPPSQRKRKRPDGQETDGEDGTDDEGRSRLQKRKKEALSRTTSLTNMAKATASQTSTPKAAVAEPGGGTKAEVHDDDGELDMEADLEAAFAEDFAEDEAAS